VAAHHDHQHKRRIYMARFSVQSALFHTNFLLSTLRIYVITECQSTGKRLTLEF